MLCTMLALGVVADDDTPVHNALKNALEQIFSSSELTDAGKTAIANLLEDCELTSSPFTAVLDDAVDAVNKCRDAVVDKSDKAYLTSADNARFKTCTFAARDVYKKHGGGVNFLAQPALDEASMTKLHHCADGQGDIGEAFGVVLNRYTPCELDIKQTHVAAFNDALTSSSRGVGEARQAGVRQICNNLYEFEQLHKSVTRFAASSVANFFDLFTDSTERRA